MKWATELAIKTKAKGKRRERNKNRIGIAKNKTKQKFKFWLMRIREKPKKKMLDYIQHPISRNLKSLVLDFSLLAIPMLTSQKIVQKGGFSPKCSFS